LASPPSPSKRHPFNHRFSDARNEKKSDIATLKAAASDDTDERLGSRVVPSQQLQCMLGQDSRAPQQTRCAAICGGGGNLMGNPRMPASENGRKKKLSY
jgi:hypothetical protein